MTTAVASIAMVFNIATTSLVPPKEPDYEPIGSYRVTYYCPSCNSPSGSHASSSGERLSDGHVACSWLPLGAKIKIDGKKYEVVDRCGTEAIDIFVDTESCRCNEYGTHYAKIQRKK